MPQSIETTESPSARRHARVLFDLRRQIVSGRLRPGSKLPTRRDLIQRTGHSSLIVQQALDKLIAEGFVSARGRHGTFVSDDPPHLRNIALVYPGGVAAPRFYEAIHAAAPQIAREQNLCFREYSISTNALDRRDLAAFMTDMRGNQFGAAIFACPPGALGTEFPDALTIPFTAIQIGADPKFQTVGLDIGSFHQSAMTYLAAQGRTRVAHLRFSRSGLSLPLEQAAKSHGLETRPYWFQAVPEGSLDLSVAGSLVSLLMELEGPKRPNALIIYDDNLTDHVVAGLLRAGVRVPDELLVVTHANFPLPPGGDFPLVRIGFDCHELLQTCLSSIRSNPKTPSPIAPPLVARFEHESANHYSTV